MKLLRPLHRQRTRRHNRSVVANRAELAAYLGQPPESLEDYLTAQGISYHKDSQGELWASLPAPPRR